MSQSTATPPTEQEVEKQVNEILSKYNLTILNYIRIDEWFTNVISSVSFQSLEKLQGYRDVLHSDDFDTISVLIGESEKKTDAFTKNCKLVAALLELKLKVDEIKNS